MNLLAKTIIPEQFWVVVGDSGKVGNIDKNESGYTLKINGNQHYYNSCDDIQRDFSITMDSGQLHINRELYTDLPTDGEIYNPVIDVKKKLYLYTKTADSKCYYASGWFLMFDDSHHEIVFCPKYIFLQRKLYLGPFYSQQEAHLELESLLNN